MAKSDMEFLAGVQEKLDTMEDLWCGLHVLASAIDTGKVATVAQALLELEKLATKIRDRHQLPAKYNLALDKINPLE